MQVGAFGCLVVVLSGAVEACLCKGRKRAALVSARQAKRRATLSEIWDLSRSLSDLEANDPLASYSAEGKFIAEQVLGQLDDALVALYREAEQDYMIWTDKVLPEAIARFRGGFLVAGRQQGDSVARLAEISTRIYARVIPRLYSVDFKRRSIGLRLVRSADQQQMRDSIYRAIRDELIAEHSENGKWSGYMASLSKRLEEKGLIPNLAELANGQLDEIQERAHIAMGPSFHQLVRKMLPQSASIDSMLQNGDANWDKLNLLAEHKYAELYREAVRRLCPWLRLKAAPRGCLARTCEALAKRLE